MKKMRIVENIDDLGTSPKYGTIYNNYRLGFGTAAGGPSSVLDSRSSMSVSVGPKKETEDLLGLSNNSMFENFPKVHIFLPS